MPHCCRFKRVVHSVTASLAILLCIALAPTGAKAQNTSSGTVTGQVTDAQGKAIVGAVITLTNTATNTTQATITNNDGRYAFINLNPGTYTVDGKKEGFKEALVKNQSVALGKPLTINLPLQVGAATQTVEVTATGAELQTMNATVGTTVNSDAIMKLPALGRDANSLTMLQPNTAPDGGIAGAEMDENSYTLDGGSNSDDMDGAHSIYTPSSGNTGTGAGGAPSGVMPTPAESIETFTVGVNNQSADINSAAGSSVTMATKRGTDSMHGSAYEYYLGSALAANSWSNNASGIARSVNHQNRFGASLGGAILPKFLGGKTYLFGDFEGRRYPNYANYGHNTPTDSLRHGVIALTQKDGSHIYVNLTPTSQTVKERVGSSYVSTSVLPADGVGSDPGCTNNGSGDVACDPLLKGLNPVTAAIWAQMPAGNLSDAHPGGDGGFNTATFNSALNESLQSNFFVGRLDHNFGSKNQFTSTYHFYSFNPRVNSQVDVGGGIPGDTFGQAESNAVRPELPAMFTAGLTSSVTSNFTNHFEYSYLRNFWQWSGIYTAPQNVGSLGTLGGTMELSGETANGLQPYNVNNQNTRQRYWDGIGQTFADDMTLLRGNHVFSFGGKYVHQYDQHQRNDNGGSINTTTAYLTTSANISNPYQPVGYTGTKSGFFSYYDEILGIVSQSQSLYSRSGPKLSLQPQGTFLNEDSQIPLYNGYFSDAWHLKPNLTLTWGAGYTVEMPPHENQGNQVEAVDGNGNPIIAEDYINATRSAALGGEIYNPNVGFATVNNINGGEKYPYNPFYGGFSPRVSMAWNPNINDWLFGGNKTVIRGGWSRIFGRLNGVDLVLVPLLGTGLAQPIACQAPLPGNVCAGVNNPNANPSTAFRIGPTSLGFNGMTVGLGAPPTATLPQPYYPGAIQNGVVNPNAGSNDTLDPNFKPDRSDEFDLTIQRQITPAFSTEIGYTGRILRNEYQSFNLDAVPYMLTVNGQQFQQAFAQMALQMLHNQSITDEPWFDGALGGANSAYCGGNCAAAVAAQYGPSGNDTLDPQLGFDVYSLWSGLQSSSAWNLGRTTMDAPTKCTVGTTGCPANGTISSSGQVSALFSETANGYGNYNGVFWTVTMRNFHGLTAISNFTYSRAFGLGDTDQATSEYTVNDPFNLHAMYGPQYNDTPLNYNIYFIYEPGAKTQHGLMGHLLNGWSFAPIFTWSDGGYNEVGNENECDAFGEGNCNFQSANETAIKVTGYTGGTNPSYNVAQPGQVGSNGNAANGGNGINQFGLNAGTVYSEFRPIILGYDTTGGSGFVPALSVWNVDFSVTKDLAISERFSTELNAQATNVFNHFSPANPGLNIDDPAGFGVIGGNNLASRQIEVGLAVRW